MISQLIMLNCDEEDQIIINYHLATIVNWKEEN